MAKQLAQEEINVVVNDICSEAEARHSVSLCRKEGVEAYYFKADISNPKCRAKLTESIKQNFGRLDILVNNAGVAPKERKDILEATEESFDRVLSINLKGPYFLTQLISKWMIQQKHEDPGREPLIVNISSISAYTSSPDRGEYCISKAGVSMMTKLYADKLASYGINVYEIRPGVIYTDMTSKARNKYDALFKSGFTPIARWGQPEDVARVVAGFAKGLYRYSTGEVINVDGGFHLRRL